MNKKEDLVYDTLYNVMAIMDNQDISLEYYPNRLIEELDRAGFLVVPKELPYEVLGEAAISEVGETGNPKHLWDFLLLRVKVKPPLNKDLR